jgi:hypothetical protein
MREWYNKSIKFVQDSVDLHKMRNELYRSKLKGTEKQAQVAQRGLTETSREIMRKEIRNIAPIRQRQHSLGIRKHLPRMHRSQRIPGATTRPKLILRCQEWDGLKNGPSTSNYQACIH